MAEQSDILSNYEESVAQYEKAVLSLEKNPVYTALFEIEDAKENLKKKTEKLETAGFNDERTKALNARCNRAWKKYEGILDQEHFAGVHLLYTKAKPLPFQLYERGEFVKILSSLPDDEKKKSVAEYNAAIRANMLGNLDAIKAVASEALETKRIRDFMAVSKSMDLIDSVRISSKDEYISAENVYIYSNIKSMLERFDIRKFDFDDKDIAKAIDEALFFLKGYDPIKD
jgi:hypothetical protein